MASYSIQTCRGAAEEKIVTFYNQKAIVMITGEDNSDQVLAVIILE